TSGLNEKSVPNGTELRLDTAFEGVGTSFPPSVTQIVVSGVVYTQSDLQKKLESIRAPWKDARLAHATLRQFSQDKPRFEKAASDFLTALRAAMVAHYGIENELLTRF